MGYRRSFRKIIEEFHPGKSAPILVEIEKRYQQIAPETAFFRKSSNPLDKRLDFSAYFLALIQALESQGIDYEEIRKTSLAIAYEFVKPKNFLQKWYKKIPAKLVHTKLASILLKNLHSKVSVKGHEDGFKAAIITAKEETYGLGYGIDVLECGICKMFQQQRAGKYASILCEVDEITSNLAGLELIRTGTIANGANKCDFRFRKKGLSKVGS